MVESYLWLKVIHVIAVISWMAGLFYLPRLFVYHSENIEKNEVTAVFAVMERKLLGAIMRPACLLAIVSGLLVIWLGNWFGPVPGWLWLKLVFVLGMLAFHGLLEMHATRFRMDRERHSSQYFRVINEIPTILLIAIVVLVIVKPF